jgi:hypothetical protein
VYDILLARHAQNQRGGRKFVAFSEAALNIVKGSFPSKCFFTDFFARHHTVLKNKVTMSPSTLFVLLPLALSFRR